MEDNYLNNRLRNSMDTPRNIPFDESEWEKVVARLDAAQPSPQPFAWHWVAFAALIPLLGWNIWLHSKLNDASSIVAQNHRISVIDTVITKHTTIVFDTVYRVVNKNIDKNTTIQNIDNQIFINKKENQFGIAPTFGNINSASNPNMNVHRNKDKNSISNTIITTNLSQNASVNQGNTENIQAQSTTTTSGISSSVGAPSEVKNTTQNEPADGATLPLKSTNAPVDSSSLVVNGEKNPIEKTAETIVDTKTETNSTVSKIDEFEATTPTKITPAPMRPHLRVQALVLETGSTLSHHYDEASGGIGIQFKLASQWSLLTGLQLSGGQNRNFRDSFPKHFIRPQPKQKDDNYRDADIEHFSFNVPIMVRWQPSYFDKYRIKPYISMGSVINFGGNTKINYRFEDQTGMPYREKAQENGDRANFFAAANIGAEAKIYKKFAIFTQFQYATPLGKSQKIGNEYQNMMLQGGIKYNF